MERDAERRRYRKLYIIFYPFIKFTLFGWGGEILGMDYLQVPWFAFEMLNNQGTQRRKHVELCFLDSNDKMFLELICLKWKDLVGRFFDTKNNISKQETTENQQRTFEYQSLSMVDPFPIQRSLGFWCIIT